MVREGPQLLIISVAVEYSKSSAFGSGVTEQAIARYEMKVGMCIAEGGVQAKAQEGKVSDAKLPDQIGRPHDIYFLRSLARYPLREGKP